jgi:hypothetical protein
MNRWATIHEEAFRALLEPGEELRGAERVIVAGLARRRRRDFPRSGFVLAVTDRRVISVAASRWLARPGLALASWRWEEGVALRASRLGRLHLVLPDRSVVTLRPFGLRSIAHLAP